MITKTIDDERNFTFSGYTYNYCCQWQQQITLNYARQRGYKIIKQPNKGHLDIEVSEEYHNLITIHTNRLQASCDSNYELKMITATGRVKTSKNCRDYSMGTMVNKDFPATIKVKFKDKNGDWLEFIVKLLYPTFRYRVDLLKG